MHSREASSPDDHYLRLKGACLRPTRASRLTHHHLTNIQKHAGLLCVYGGYGLGKTVAVKTGLHDTAPTTAHRFQYAPGIPQQDFKIDLAAALGLHEGVTESRRTLERFISTTLAKQPLTLAFDEAQGLSNHILEYIRSLWDDPTNRLAVVLVGSDTFYRRLRRLGSFSNRITDWQHYTPLRPDEVLETMPTYHPLLTQISHQDLQWLDDMACHGNFRNWAKFTHHLQLIVDDKARTETAFSRRLAREILTDMDRAIHPDDDSGGYL
ncbi:MULTISPECIES: ATP-binding protein [unclassified Streptomyces]|uniref:ATP-binding protein n=1 Tax=unclassified Streptomyces TaxID=2593676 RepID=UPI002E18A900|nr:MULTISPECIES: ATP-binding protein [unclassified Streptomyces]